MRAAFRNAAPRQWRGFRAVLEENDGRGHARHYLSMAGTEAGGGAP